MIEKKRKMKKKKNFVLYSAGKWVDIRVRNEARHWRGDASQRPVMNFSIANHVLLFSIFFSFSSSSSSSFSIFSIFSIFLGVHRKIHFTPIEHGRNDTIPPLFRRRPPDTTPLASAFTSAPITIGAFGEFNPVVSGCWTTKRGKILPAIDAALINSIQKNVNRKKKERKKIGNIWSVILTAHFNWI